MSSGSGKGDRLSVALRENLRKRKEQARSRRDVEKESVDGTAQSEPFNPGQTGEAGS